MRYKLPLKEKLKSKLEISNLYEKGQTIKVYPLRIIYTKSINHHTTQVGFSVPKRNFKKAVDRNRIKRQLREQYRLNKYIISSRVNNSYTCMISFIDKKHWESKKIDSKMKTILKLLNNEINKEQK